MLDSQSSFTIPFTLLNHSRWNSKLVPKAKYIIFGNDFLTKLQDKVNFKLKEFIKHKK